MHTHLQPAFELFGPSSTLGSGSGVSDRKAGSVVIIDIAGPLVGEARVNAFCDRVENLFEMGAWNFAINLAAVDYGDSRGLGGLAFAYNLIEHAGGKIKFFAASDRLRRTLERLRLDQVLEIHPDEASALSHFRLA